MIACLARFCFRAIPIRVDGPSGMERLAVAWQRYESEGLR